MMNEEKLLMINAVIKNSYIRTVEEILSYRERGQKQ
jgi:hypothetical protein